MAKIDVNYPNSKNSAVGEAIRKRRWHATTHQLATGRFPFSKQTLEANRKGNCRGISNWTFPDTLITGFRQLQPQREEQGNEVAGRESEFGQVRAPHQMERESQTKWCAG